MNSASHQYVSDLSINANVNEVRNAAQWLLSCCRDFGVPDDQIARLDICLHETLANIISHGGPTSLSSNIFLGFEGHLEQAIGEVAVTVIDSGSAFDPSHTPVSPQAKTLAETDPGGLGLVMIHGNSDSLAYSYSNGQNKLRFSIRWNTGAHNE